MSNSISQPNRIFWTLICVLLPLVGSATNLQAQVNSPEQLTEKLNTQDTPEQLTEKLTRQQALKLQEIADLRARMGGGVTEQLKGVVDGVDPEQQFLDSLTSRVQEQESMQPELPTGRATKLPLPTQRAPASSQETRLRLADPRTQAFEERVYESTVLRGPDPDPRGRGVGSRRSPANAENAQRVLRSSAKKLEQLAAELEQAQFYDKADQLRKTAAKYWLQARSMD